MVEKLGYGKVGRFKDVRTQVRVVIISMIVMCNANVVVEYDTRRSGLAS